MSARDRGGYGVDDDDGDDGDDGRRSTGSGIPGAPDDGGSSDPSTPDPDDDDNGIDADDPADAPSASPPEPEPEPDPDPPSDDDGSSGGSGLPGSIPGAPDDGGSSDPSTPEPPSDDDGIDTDDPADAPSASPPDQGIDPDDPRDAPSASPPGDGGSSDPPTPDDGDDATRDPGAGGDGSDSRDRVNPGGSGVPGAPNDGGASDPSTDPGADATPGGGTETQPGRRQGESPDRRIRQRASDEAIREDLRERAAENSDVNADEIAITGFRENDSGEIQAVFARESEFDSRIEEVPESFRDQLRENVASQSDDTSLEDVVLTEGDDGFRVALSDAAQRERVAEQLDEQFSNVNIGEEDITRADDGDGFTVDDTTAEQINNSRRQFIDELGGDPVGEEVEDPAAGARPGMERVSEELVREAQASQQSDTRGSGAGSQPDPGAAATAVGGAFQAFGNSPLGRLAENASDRVFGDTSNPNDALSGRINRFLEEVETEFDERIARPVQEADPDQLDPRSAGLARPFGLTGEDYKQFATDFTEFTNPGTIGQDFVRLAEGGAQAREFFVNRGPEGVAIAGDVIQQGASAAPGAAREAAEQVAENPRDAALTGAALTATFGTGAAASGLARGGASVASRGARFGGRRLDDAIDATGRARRAGDSISDAAERAPDVSVRRDPTSGPLDVDPMLQQQINDAVKSIDVRSRVSAGVDRVREVNAPSGDGTAQVFGRPQGAANAAESTARRVADRASELEDRLRDANRPAGDSSSDVFGRPTRTTRPAVAVGESRVRSALDGVSERLGALNEPVGAGTAGVFGRPLRGSLPRVSEGEGVLARLNRANDGSLSSSQVFGRPMSNDFAAGLDRFRPSRRGGTAEIFGRPEQTAAVAERVSQFNRPNVLGGLRSLTPDRSVSELASDASDLTLRFGPARPARTEIDASDLDIEFDDFDDDIDFGLDDAGSGGGRTDFGADVDVDGGSGGGSGQLSTLRTSRRGETDVDVETEVRSSRRTSPMANNGPTALFGGLVSGSGFLSIFSDQDAGGITDGFEEVDGAIGSDSSSLDDLAVDLTSSPTTSTPGTTTGIDISLGTGTTTTTTPDTTTDLSTNQVIQPAFLEPTFGRSQSRIPSQQVDPNRDDDAVGLDSFETADEIFDTGVADAGDVLDEVF